MSRFYLRVFKDGVRERTWGCGSRSENNQHYKDYVSNLCEKITTCDPLTYSGPTLGKHYRIELIKNRHGEKELYREIEFELSYKYVSASIVKCKDVTHITDTFDPRVLVLPPDW